MFRITYLSRPAEGLRHTDLDTILAQARRGNSSLGITGLLVFTGDIFFQVLEGQQNDVERVFDKVFMDPRHRQIRVLQRGNCAARRFKKWSMGFRQLNEADAETEAFFALSRTAFEARIPSDAAEKFINILQGFSDTRLSA